MSILIFSLFGWLKSQDKSRHVTLKFHFAQPYNFLLDLLKYHFINLVVFEVINADKVPRKICNALLMPSLASIFLSSHM